MKTTHRCGGMRTSQGLLCVEERNERIQDTDSLIPSRLNDSLTSGENPWAVIIPHSLLSAVSKEKDCAK